MQAVLEGVSSSASIHKANWLSHLMDSTGVTGMVVATEIVLSDILADRQRGSAERKEEENRENA